MPEITLDIPKGSRFNCSLNEIDMAMKEIFIERMRVADPRDISREQNSLGETNDKWLWDKTRVFQVDELTTEEIFDTYLLRKNINGEKNTDISYPLLGYVQNDVKSVYWGVGNRITEYEFVLPADPLDWAVGSSVVIKTYDKYRGYTGKIAETKIVNGTIYCTVEVNGKVITKQPFDRVNDNTKVWFTTEQLRLTEEKTTQTFKGKAITTTYTATVLTDNRDELQYIRDRLMLRVWDTRIWWKYKSPTIDMHENQIFTVFGIPNIERFPSSEDKLKGQGFIYATSFTVSVWAAITDEPIPEQMIESIHMHLKVENDGRVNRIVIN